MRIVAGRPLAHPHLCLSPRRFRPFRAIIPAVLLATILATTAHAQTGGGYDLSWNTTDGGGATFLSGGGFSLGGTTGQPDAGSLSGGGFTLGGGFWGGGPLVATSVPPSSGPDAPGAGVTLAFALHPSRPNPFNPQTAIRFDLPSASPVSLVIYDVRGERVRTLVDRPLPAGQHSAAWDGTNDAGARVASGAYFLRLVAAGGTAEQKLIVTK